MTIRFLIILAIASVLATIFVIGCHQKPRLAPGTQVIIEKDGCKYWTMDDGYGHKQTYADCRGKRDDF